MGELADVELRPIAPPDAEGMARLHLAVWEEAYAGLMPDSVFAERRDGLPERIEHWRRIIDASPAPTTVASYDGTLVGFATVGPARDAGVAVPEEVWALYVRAAWWGKGLGHRLLTETLADRPAYLWVLAGNERGVSFYRRHGFAFDGVEQADPVGVELRMVRS